MQNWYKFKFPVSNIFLISTVWHSSRYSDGHFLGFFFFCWGHQRKATSHTFQNFNILKNSTPFDSQFGQAWQRFRVWSLESKFSFSFLCRLLCFSFCLFPLSFFKICFCFSPFLDLIVVFPLQSCCSSLLVVVFCDKQSTSVVRKRNFNQSKRELVSIPIFLAHRAVVAWRTRSCDKQHGQQQRWRRA